MGISIDRYIICYWRITITAHFYELPPNFATYPKSIMLTATRANGILTSSKLEHFFTLFQITPYRSGEVQRHFTRKVKQTRGGEREKLHKTINTYLMYDRYRRYEEPISVARVRKA